MPSLQTQQLITEAVARDTAVYEALILSELSEPNPDFNTAEIKKLMYSVVLASFARKIQREPFVEILTLAFQIFDYMAELEKGMDWKKILVAMEPGKVPEKLDAELNVLVNAYLVKKLQLAEKFNLVTQCPTAQDTVA